LFKPLDVRLHELLARCQGFRFVGEPYYEEHRRVPSDAPRPLD
jgi:hypothetical protein